MVATLSQHHPANITLGLTIGVWTENLPMYYDLVRLATKLYGPATSIKTITKGKRPTNAIWNYHATLHLLNFKDEATLSWLLLSYENN